MKYTGHMGKKAFGSLEDCKRALDRFAEKYNNQWVHSGINNVTPRDRFEGLDKAVCQARQRVLDRARARNPQRWISGHAAQYAPAGKQWLNPDRDQDDDIHSAGTA